MKIFFDGGLRPGGMELAVMCRGRHHVERGLGPGTSMDAEWLALIAAMRVAARFDVADAVLLGDSAAVVAQAMGRVRVPPSCRHHAATFAALPRPSGRVRLRHIGRAQNLAGILLSGLHDGKRVSPDQALTLATCDHLTPGSFPQR